MGTAVVCAVMVAVVAAIITGIVRDKKKGKTSCGSNCAHCAIAGACHKNSSPSPSRNGGFTTVLKVGGMMCGMCESHINDAVRNGFSVKSVKSSYKKGVVVISSPAPLEEERLRSVIADTGYTLENILYPCKKSS